MTALQAVEEASIRLRANCTMEPRKKRDGRREWAIWWSKVEPILEDLKTEIRTGRSKWHGEW